MVDERQTLALSCAVIYALEIRVSAVAAVSLTCQIRAINLNKNLFSVIRKEFVLKTLVWKKNSQKEKEITKNS